MVQFRAKPTFIAYSRARSLTTGNAPGRPRQTGHVRVLGASPNLFAQPQKIFVFVLNWRWTSNPITVSYFVFTVWLIMRSFSCAIQYFARRYRRSEKAFPHQMV